jgi:hypothetical protein
LPKATSAQPARCASVRAGIDITKVLLSGCSAGGLSTYLHADYVGELLAVAAPRMTKYAAAPVSGFFLDHATVEGVPVYANQIQVIFGLSNASAGLNQNCIASLPAEKHWWVVSFT